MKWSEDLVNKCLQWRQCWQEKENASSSFGDRCGKLEHQGKKVSLCQRPGCDTGSLTADCVSEADLKEVVLKLVAGGLCL
jgi:hypothetical protein